MQMRRHQIAEQKKTFKKQDLKHLFSEKSHDIWLPSSSSSIRHADVLVIGRKFQKVENVENRFFAINSSKLFKN